MGGRGKRQAVVYTFLHNNLYYYMQMCNIIAGKLRNHVSVPSKSKNIFGGNMAL